MRRLTEDEISDASGWVYEDWHSKIAEAQLKEVAEWFVGRCTEHETAGLPGRNITPRYNCPTCLYRVGTWALQYSKGKR